MNYVNVPNATVYCYKICYGVFFFSIILVGCIKSFSVLILEINPFSMVSARLCCCCSYGYVLL